MNDHNLKPMTKGRKVIKVNALSFAKLIEALIDGVFTCRQLAEHSGLHYRTVTEQCRALHHVGAIHICDWEADGKGRFAVAVFKLGRGKDVQMKRAPSSVRTQRWRDKVKQQQVALVTAGAGRFVKSRNGLLRFEPINQQAAI